MKLRLVMFLSLAVWAASIGSLKAQDNYISYQVKPGDGLDAIARQYKTSSRTLRQLNGIINPDELLVGQIIRVPSSTPVDPLASAETAFTEPTPAPAIEPANTASPASPVSSEALRVNRTGVKKTKVSRPKTMVHPAVVNTTLKSAVEPKVVKQTALPAAAKPTSSTKPFLSDYEEPRRNQSEMPAGRLILDLIVKLAIVLAIAYGAIYVLRMLMGRQVSLPGKRGHLKVLESASLGPNRSIHLVKIGSEVMVLGSTNDQITTIARVEDPTALEQPVAETSANPFAMHLSGALQGEPKPADLTGDVRSGIKHLWDCVQEIRSFRGWKENAR